MSQLNNNLASTQGSRITVIGALRGFALFGVILFSRWWLERFKYGPWEWFWRSATYLKWQPFKR